MKKINFLNIHLIFLISSFFILSILSILSKFEFYYLKWHYLSTPIGLIHGKISSNLELNQLFLYLSSLNTNFDFSLIQIYLVFILIFLSFSYIIILKKQGGLKC